MLAGLPAFVLRVADHVGERERHFVEQPGADLAEALVAFVGGEVDHPQDMAVLVPEVEELVDERDRGVVAGPSPPRPVRGRAPASRAPSSAISSASARIAVSTSAKYW